MLIHRIMSYFILYAACSYYIVKSKTLVVEPTCATRDKLQACNEISDRTICLTTLETRGYGELKKIYGIYVKRGSKCGWCPNGPCSSDNSTRCEPMLWIQTRNISDFEDCLPGITVVCCIHAGYFNI